VVDMGSRCAEDLKESSNKSKAVIDKIESW